MIPREGGHLVRLYVEMDKLGEEERVANRGITLDKLIAAAQRILHPYKLDVKEVPWWSVYEIGQRICDQFDDVPTEEAGTRPPHVFIAGDACHTHSPKAGQGMNFSMQDSFNLGWKLAAVLSSICVASIGRRAPWSWSVRSSTSRISCRWARTRSLPASSRASCDQDIRSRHRQWDSASKALGLGMCSLLPSLWLRKLVMVAWPTPGAAVLATLPFAIVYVATSADISCASMRFGYVIPVLTMPRFTIAGTGRRRDPRGSADHLAGHAQRRGACRHRLGLLGVVAGAIALFVQQYGRKAA